MIEATVERTYELYVSYDPETDDLAASLELLSNVISNQTKADKIMAPYHTKIWDRTVLKRFKDCFGFTG